MPRGHAIRWMQNRRAQLHTLACMVCRITGDQSPYPCSSCGDLGDGNRCPYTAAQRGSAQTPNPGYGAAATGIANTSLAQRIAAYQSHIAQQNAAAAAQQNALGPGLGNLAHYIPPIPLGALGHSAPNPVPAAPALPPTTTSFGELIGWRIWRVHSGFLISYFMDFVWPPNAPIHAPGIEDHNNLGIWAFKTQQRALNKLISSSPHHALGSVYLWGLVIEHTDGFRAEWAKVRSIDFLT